MNVIIYKNRGAIIPDYEQFVRNHEGCVVLPFDMVRNMEVYRFDCVFQGLEPAMWAKFWLLKGDKRARNAGCIVPVPYLLKESKITGRACLKSFKKSTKRSKPTKVKMVGGLFNTSLF